MGQGVDKRLIAGVLAFTVLASALILAFVKTAPFLFAGILGFLCCLFLSFSFNRSRFWKLFFYVAGIAILAGGAVEAYFSWFGTSLVKKDEVQTQEWALRGGDYYVADDARGYAAGPGVRKRVRKSLGERVIYDVVYTTNVQGLRVAPHDVPGALPGGVAVARNVVFMGDSFTFGEGLNDDETIPYRFEMLSEGRSRTFNFGFHGYGAQQMLRLVETGVLDKIVGDQTPLVVVYGALIQHAERAAGKMIWDPKVPKYTLSPSGRAEFAGTFADDPALNENMKRSKRLSDPRAQLIAGLTGPPRTPNDIRLFVQIVLQARDELAKRHARFLVLLWPLGDEDADRVAGELRQAGVEVISTEQVFSQYPDPPESYRIEMDNHPTRLATERIARFLGERLQ